MDSCEEFKEFQDDGETESVENDAKTISMDSESPIITNQLETTNQHKLYGYCIVSDNIDKNIRRSYQRQDCTTNSFIHMQYYEMNRPRTMKYMMENLGSNINKQQFFKMIGKFWEQ